MADADWNLYRTFLAVMESGSLSGAARRLRITQPTAGRQVEALEAQLGASLFTRSPAGLAPTDTALALKPHAEAMAAAAEALSRTASGDAEEAAGTIRLTASEVVGAEVLPPILAAFREQHPKIELELVLTNRQEDLLHRHADIAVRMARPAQQALLARRIGAIPLRLYAHRAYLQRHGEPRTLTELLDHTLIGYDRQAPPDGIRMGLGFEIRREMFAVRCDSELAQLAALRAGVGICGCQAGIAARDPNLVPVVAEALRLDLEMWLAMHEDLRASRRLRLLFDHLAEGLSAYVAESRAADG